MKAYQGMWGVIYLWTLASSPEEAQEKFINCLKDRDLFWDPKLQVEVSEITTKVEYLIA